MHTYLARASCSSTVTPTEVIALIDERWYFEAYPDVAAEGLSAIAHYMTLGWAEGKNPNPLFDTEWYFKQYPDVEFSGINPLTEYATKGWRKGRQPNQLFDPAWYIRQAKLAADIEPLSHYISGGEKTAYISTHPQFDAAKYARDHPEIIHTNINPLVHFLTFGSTEKVTLNRPRHPVTSEVLDQKSAITPMTPGTSASSGEMAVNANTNIVTSSTSKLQIKVAAPYVRRTDTFDLGAVFHARAVSRQPGAVAVVCWDGGHNPIGRAKVLYDAVASSRPVFLITYLFPEFGGKLWPPLKSEPFNFLGIPWRDRDAIHLLLSQLDIKFDTIWICKPRLPSFLLAGQISRPDTKLILDIDDNEEHFAKSAGSRTKIYGQPGLGNSLKLLNRVTTRTVASKTLMERFGGSIVRHARPKPAVGIASKPKSSKLKVGFLGTVRAHKNVLDAAKSIEQYAKRQERDIRFHVYGDIAPAELRTKIEATGAVLHDVIPLSEAEKVVQDCDVMITGFPSESPADTEITKYQITAKIGDSLVNNRPVLVPDTPGVSDLRSLNGVYLFNKNNFTAQLDKALGHSSPISLPDEFDLANVTDIFLEAEKQSAEARRARDVFAEIGLSSGAMPATRRKETIVLVWKQHDAGLYGRRVDQIARSYKGMRPEADVIVLELMHKSTFQRYETDALDCRSDFLAIHAMAKDKICGGYLDSDGVRYQTLLYEADGSLPLEFGKFLARQQLGPENTKFVVFPIVRGLEYILSALIEYPLIVDFVDNQFAWATDNDRIMMTEQYAILAASACQIAFNSEHNMQHFKQAGLLPDSTPISVIPNWYQTPKALVNWQPPETTQPSVVYTGNMNDRIDWALLNAVADTGLQVHLAGNAYRAPQEFYTLLERTNVCYHGPLCEEDAFRLTASSRVAIMPHAQDKFSDFMNPLKLHMYQAIGVPVITTNVKGVCASSLIYIASTHEEFISKLLQKVREASNSSNTPQAESRLCTDAQRYGEILSTALPRDSLNL